jgi:hypothetical protein
VEKHWKTSRDDREGLGIWKGNYDWLFEVGLEDLSHSH